MLDSVSRFGDPSSLPPHLQQSHRNEQAFSLQNFATHAGQFFRLCHHARRSDDALLCAGSIGDRSRREKGEKQAQKANESGEKDTAAAQDTKKQASGEEQTKSKPAKKQPAEAKPQPAKTDSSESKPSQPADAKKDAEPAKPDPNAEWIAKGVWVDPPTEGPAAVDFALVGEYVGDLATPADQNEDDSDAEKSASRLGVQIRNLGTGQFEARAYQGGLPGQESYVNEKPMVLLGRRSGSTLVLSGGPWAMFAGPDQCKIINESGETLATLPRVERQSPTLGAKPPEGAMVLFDGTDTSQFAQGRMTAENLLARGARINFLLSDFDLHVEFRIPHMPKMTGQQRGNSGIYLQSRYECQVLDSFGEANVFNGLGALYRHKAPKFNMALPPLIWQTYDIHFTAARFGVDGKKLRNARVTSWVNGVKVQDDEELPGPTGHGQPESPTLLSTLLQDHSDPVRYRNVWVIDRGLTGGVPFPQMADDQ
ncbi:3-keto-disaccharide hydrolase [Rhodopirellula sallentina]|uniref:Large multi-functional protein n=1 Tax=Rhodopirellula sallentina SM41 TaxID=1263870 RepID=M5U015_9BACT|nr:DUF1080 domain-containing protein [Rhodopirellula sallentina]EMI54629.1 large multi-functional protein [Rhodopirellula sallentina SM41]